MPKKNRKTAPAPPTRGKTAALADRLRSASIEHTGALFAPYVRFEQPPTAWSPGPSNDEGKTINSSTNQENSSRKSPTATNTRQP